MWRADRKWCKKVTVEEMPAALARFFSSDPCATGALDPDLAKSVLKGDQGLLAKIAALRAWSVAMLLLLVSVQFQTA